MALLNTSQVDRHSINYNTKESIGLFSIFFFLQRVEGMRLKFIRPRLNILRKDEQSARAESRALNISTSDWKIRNKSHRQHNKAEWESDTLFFVDSFLLPLKNGRAKNSKWNRKGKKSGLLRERAEWRRSRIRGPGKWYRALSLSNILEKMWRVGEALQLLSHQMPTTLTDVTPTVCIEAIPFHH